MEYSSGVITLCIPYSTLEPLRDKLQSGYQSDKVESDKEWSERFTEELKLTNVEITAELGKTELTGKEILNLRKGDVILLDQYFNDELDVYIGDHLKFTGYPGIYKGNQSVQISQIIMEEEVYHHGTN